MASIQELIDYLASAAKEDKRTKGETAKDQIAAAALNAIFPPAGAIKAIKDNPIFAKFYRENPNKVNRAIEYGTTIGAGAAGGGWAGAAAAGGLKAVTDRLPIIGSDVADEPLSVGNATNVLAAVPGGGVLGKLGTRVAPKMAAAVVAKTGPIAQQALRAAGESMAAELALNGEVTGRSAAAGAATGLTGAAVSGVGKLLAKTGASIHAQLDKVLAKLPNRAQVMEEIDPVNTAFLKGRAEKAADSLKNESLGLGYAGQAARDQAVRANMEKMIAAAKLRTAPPNKRLLRTAALAQAQQAAKEMGAEATSVASRKRKVDIEALQPKEQQDSLLKMLGDAASDDPAKRDWAVKNVEPFAQEVAGVDPRNAFSNFYVRSLIDNATDSNDLLRGSALGKSVSAAPANVLRALGEPSGWGRDKLLGLAKELDQLQLNPSGNLRSGLRLYKQPISLNLDSIANAGNRIGGFAFNNSKAVRNLAQNGTQGRTAGIVGRQTAAMVDNSNPQVERPAAYAPSVDPMSVPEFDPNETAPVPETTSEKKKEGSKKDPSSIPEFDPNEF